MKILPSVSSLATILLVLSLCHISNQGIAQCDFFSNDCSEFLDLFSTHTVFPYPDYNVLFLSLKEGEVNVYASNLLTSDCSSSGLITAVFSDGSASKTYDCNDALLPTILGVNVFETVTVTRPILTDLTCSVFFLIRDNAEPHGLDPTNIIAPQTPTACGSKTIQLDAFGNASLSVADLDVAPYQLYDACGFTASLSQTSFDCSDLGTAPITLTATDPSGNTFTCNPSITVQDVTPPNITCSNITVQLNTHGEAGFGVAAQDNCVNVNFSGLPGSFDCTDLGPNTFTWTATDGSGNSSSCTPTVTVVDLLDPVAKCKNFNIQLDPSGNYILAPGQIDNNSTDNCLIANRSVNPNSFDCADLGTNTVTLTVIDQSNNSSTCTSTVTVQDLEKPKVYCKNITVQLNSTGNVSISATQVDNNSTDNCNIVNRTVTPASFNCGDVGANTVTLTITDQSNNFKSCTSTVTVQDATAPNAICKNISIPLVTGLAAITGNDIDNNSSDNCGISSYEADPDTFYCADVGANMVILTVTDVNGNIHTCNSTVTVTDVNILDLTASDASTNDAYIYLDWDIPVCCYDNANGQPLYLQINNLDQNQEIYSEIIDDPNQFVNGLYSSSWPHLAGPGQLINYELKLYILGLGSPICPPANDQGSTLPFKRPNVSASVDQLTEINLDIINNSDLLTYYRIYRDGGFLTNLTGLDTAAFSDLLDASVSSSIINGQPYDYCIAVYNGELDEEYDTVCRTGNTVDIDFQASDELFPDQINLSWNDISIYTNKIKITRDGVLLTLIGDNTETSFTDSDVVPGKNHDYGIWIVTNEGELQVARDIGRVAANGSVSGYAYTFIGNYALSNLTIEALSIVDSDTTLYTVETDLNGYYSFTELYYGESSVLSITAIDTNRNFIENPILVSLSESAPVVTGVNFADSTIYIVDTLTSIGLANLQLTPVPDQDKVSVDISYTTINEIVWFQLFRLDSTVVDSSVTVEEKLIVLINDSMDTFPVHDLSGIPKQRYTYKLSAYTVSNDTISKATLYGNVTFPDVSPVETLSALPNITLGTAIIGFTHTSNNIYGHNIYRKDKLAVFLEDGLQSYEDFGGQPGDSIIYTVKAVRNVDGILYESVGVSAPKIEYPSLIAPEASNFKIDTVPNGIEIEWTYPTIENYNYSGFVLLRKTILTSFQPVVYIDKNLVNNVALDTYSYTDRTVTPEVNYTYKIDAYNVDDGDTTFESKSWPPIPEVRAAPVPAVSSVSATDGAYVDYVDVAWSFPYDHSIVGTDMHYLILRDQDTVGSVAYVEPYTFTDYINIDQQNTNQFTYSVISCLERNNQHYCAGAVTDNGSTIPLSGPVAVNNFSASTDFVDHIRLSWDFPDFITDAVFYLTRDGVFLDTLPGHIRQYYDTVHAPGNHVYQIKSWLPQGIGFSQYRTAQGSRRSVKVLRGVISTAVGQHGVGNVRVTAFAYDNSGAVVFEKTTFTNINGIYDFPDLEFCTPGDTLFVKAELINHIFIPDTQFVVISDTQKIYVINFDDYSPPGVPSGNNIAKPINLVLTANPTNSTVEISWGVSNSNYSGFLVSRGLGLIHEVDGNSLKFVIDTSGFPATEYFYSVTALWEINDSTTLQSAPIGDYIFFPPVEPLSLLSVVPSFLNNFVTISWSHPTNRIDGVILQRLDEVLDTIPETAIPEYIDFTGIPGMTYKYTATPYRITPFGIAKAEESIEFVNYPTLTRPQNLSISLPPLINNNVHLKWKLLAENYEGFNLYRNNAFIGKVGGNSIQEDYEFKDYGGTPYKITKDTLTVRTYVTRNGIPYESTPVSIFSFFADVEVASNLSLTAIEAEQAVRLNWEYIDTIGIDGFKIERIHVLTSQKLVLEDSVKLHEFDSVPKPGSVFQFEYLDEEGGIPDAVYKYVVIPYKLVDGVYYYPLNYASNTNSNINFPKIPRPYGLSLTNNFYHSTIKWKYDLEELDDFQVELQGVQGQLAVSIGKGKRKHTKFHYTPSSSNHRYRIRARRTIGGVVYNSDWVYTSYFNFNYPTPNTTPITSASDTDAIVTINWTPANMTANSYEIWRDGQKLNSVSINTLAQSATDATAVPGRIYVYEVVAIVGGTSSARHGDFGGASADGVISGQVITEVGSQGVAGVEVTAKAYVDDELYIYTAITDANGNGNFVIPEVYYGDGTATYTLTASFLDHEIVSSTGQETNVVSLQPGTGLNVASGVFFIDKTAFILSGFIKQEFSSCKLDSIQVDLTTYFGSDSTVESTFSNENGYYTFILNVNYDNLSKFVVNVKDTQQLGSVINPSIFLRDFQNNVEIPYTGGSFPRINKQNFTDQLLYPVKIFTQTVCGQIAETFTINIRSDDNCFDKTFTKVGNDTNQIFWLPAMNYVISVVDVKNVNAGNAIIRDYFQLRPQSLALLDLHEEFGGMLPTTKIGKKGKTIFTFHKPPTVELSTTADISRFCDDPNEDIVLNQGDNMILTFSASETHANDNCHVDGGYLKVLNQAALEKTEDILHLSYDPTTSEYSFSTLDFEVGEPNLIKPHRKSITVQYFSDQDEFLGQLVMLVIVTGSKANPGNDIIVSISEDATTQWPLYVLRDPPGDGSFSTLLESTSISKSLTMTKDENSVGGFTGNENATFGGVGFFIESDVRRGTGSSRSQEFELDMTTTTTLNTSDDPNTLNVGESADIILGVGVAMQYGIVQNLLIDPDSCKINQQTEIGLTPNSIATTWAYTVQGIENLIEEYKRDSIDVVSGDKVIKLSDGTIEEASASAQRFHILRKNWRNILVYHRKNTLPHYILCDKKNGKYFLPEFGSHSNKALGDLSKSLELLRKSAYINKITAALDCFCPKVIANNELIKDPSNPKQNLYWNDAILEEYNAVSNYIVEMRQSFLDGDFPDGLDFDTTGNTLIYNTAYNSLFQADAENFTVGGGTSISKEVTVGITKSISFTQSNLLSTSAAGGLAVSAEVKAGFAVLTEVLKLDAGLGYASEQNYELSQEATKSFTTEKTTSYTITDDDIGDQVSVTVIRGPAQNHTPYFQLFGGRSSCPYEEGTIARDVPVINADTVELFNVPPDGYGTFNIQLASENPFGEWRKYDLLHNPQSNTKGATVRANGSVLGTLPMGRIRMDTPIYAIITIERGPVAYDYENLLVGLQAECPEDPRTAYVGLTVHFKEPCPEVVITDPGNGWVLNKADQLMDVQPSLDLNNGVYESIVLQRRKVNQNWLQLGQPMERSFIDSIYQDFGAIPRLFIDITGDASFTDGDYELRIATNCDPPEPIYSNIISGHIDRTPPSVFGNPLPSDGDFNTGDEISVSFDELLDCTSPNSLKVVNANNTTVPISGFVTCFNNKLVFNIAQPTQVVAGDTLIASIDTVFDLYGNIMESIAVWEFVYFPLPPPPCESVPSISTTEITATSAKLNWDVVPNSESYTIIGAIAGTFMTPVQINTSGNSFAVSGLSQNTTYWWTVRTNCDADNSELYTPYDTFTTLTNCYVPINVSTKNITSTSARLRWDHVPAALHYEIQGRDLSNIFNIVKITVVDTSFTANGLTPDHTYEWSVRAYCSNLGYTQLTLPFQQFTTDTAVVPSSNLKTLFSYSSNDGDLSVSVFPNPTKGAFQVVLHNSEEEAVFIKLYDIMGNQLLSNDLSSGLVDLTINIADKPTGVYMLYVQKGDRSKSIRVIKHNE